MDYLVSLKARNDKLFRGISREPEELIRYAQSECNAWFDANRNESDDTDPPQHIGDIQGVSLENICLVDGSWTEDSQYSGLGWVWLDGTGQEQLLGLRNKQRRLSSVHSELEALIWAMENMSQHTSCQNFGTDCKDIISMMKDPRA